jgi:hypothetical protein
MILDKHWWHTADKANLVPDGDERAAFLAYPRGMEIPDDTARRLGILEPEPEPEAKAEEKVEEKVEEKAKPAPANKARTQAADK